MHQHIKDHHKVFNKLFISPTFNEDVSPPLLLSPNFITLLLQQSLALSIQGQKQLIDQILSIFIQRPINSLLLWFQDQEINKQFSNKCILDDIIIRILHVITTESQIDIYIQKITILLSHYKIGLKNINKLTQWLSLQTHCEKFNPIKLMFIVKVLKVYYSEKLGNQDAPKYYFYFFGTQKSAIRSVQHNPDEFALKNEICLSMSFCSHNILSHSSQSLCQIITDKKQQIQISFSNRIVLSIRRDKEHRQIVCSEKLSDQVWYRLVVNITPNKTQIFINDKVKTYQGSIRKEKQRKILHCCFGQSFSGMMASILIANKAWNCQKFTLEGFRYGIESWDNLISLNKTSLGSSVVISCLPFSVFDLRDTNLCFDIFRRNHSSIGENIKVIEQPIMEEKIHNLGGLKVILPLFYLSRFYSSVTYPSLLEDLLQLLLTLFQHYQYSQIDEQLNCHNWLQILSQHLFYLSEFQTLNSLKLLQSIHKKIYRQATRSTYMGLFWSLNSQSFKDEKLIQQHYSYLIKIYENERKVSNEGYSFTQIVYWMLQNLEGELGYNCCLHHYVNQSILAKDLDLLEGKTLNQHKKLHYMYLQILLANILESAIISKKENSKQMIKIIVRPILHKYSPCLYSTVLKVLKRQINKFKGQVLLGQLLADSKLDLISYLIFVSEKTINCDVISDIVFLSLFMYQYSQGTRKQEIMNFLIQLFNRMKQFTQIRVNPIVKATKKIRKKSVIFQKLQNQHITRKRVKSQGQIETKVQSQQFKSIVQLVKKCPGPQTIGQWENLYHIMLNFLSGKVSENPILNLMIINEDGIKLLQHYYFIVCNQFKTCILIHLLSSIELNKDLRLLNSMQILLTKILQHDHKNFNLLAIFAKILSQAIQTNTFCDYLIKLSEHTDIILLWDMMASVLPKIIKAMSEQELCSLITLMNYHLKVVKKVKPVLLEDTLNQLQSRTLTLLNTLFPLGLKNIEKAQKSTIQKIGQIELFAEYIGTIPQSQHTFSMEVILSSLMYEKEEENHAWELQTNKKLFVMEEFISLLLQIQQESKLTSEFMNLLKWFLQVNIRRQNYHECKSYLRYIVYYISSKSIITFPKLFQNLWLYILRDILLPHIHLEMENYQQLSEAFVSRGISPIFVQDLQIFIRLISFKELANIKKLQNQQQQAILKIINSSQFAKAITFQNKVQKIMEKIDEFNEGLLEKRYKWKSNSIIKQGSEIRVKRNIQKLFDMENIIEQNTRIKYLYDHQRMIRNCYYLWEKLWHQLRIYHESYGFWMAQKDNPNVFTYPQNKVRNFKFKISQYETDSGLHPILQSKILQPWHIIKDIKRQKKKHLQSFSEMMRPSLAKNKKSNEDNPFLNLWKNIWKLPLPSKKNLKKVREYDVLWIQRSIKALGKIFIKDHEQIMFFYEGIKQEDSHLSFQKFSLAFNRKTYCQWNIFQIKKLKIHRYLMKYEALEICLMNSKSLIFQFLKEDRNEFIRELQKIQRDRIQTVQPKLFKLNKIPFFREDFFKLDLSDEKLTECWARRQMSNLSYLIALNRKGCRGMYDLSQYMVVPWVTQIKNQKQPTLRNLSKTIGALGSEERKKILFQKYHTKDPFNPYPPFFFGTHYSSPGVVFNFLIRLSPFTQYCKHLQGGKFDIPDRLFSSLVNAWRSASTEVSDVRELIPEFYYLPEMLLNLDQNNFGKTQSQEIVNHIQLPSWAGQNPYFFIWQMRTIMESEEVSDKINDWIDLIFGFKQRGKQAEDNWNVYYYLTYEDSMTQKEQDEVYKKSKEAQIVHFGQIPPQLFDKPHRKREKRGMGLCQIEIKRTIKLMNSLKQKPIGMKIFGNEFYIIKRNLIEVLSLQSNPASLQRSKKFNLEKSQLETLYLIKKQKSNVKFLGKNYFICWGYFDNEFRIFNKSSGAIEESDCLDSRITYLATNEEENLILIGTMTGNLIVYEIQYGLSQIFIKRILTSSLAAPIVHISQHDGFFAISFGNLVGIYKIQRTLHYLCSEEPQICFILMRSFRVGIPIKASYIMSSPFFCIVIVDNANIRTYSINGQFMKKIPCSAKQSGRFKDMDLQDVLYVVEQDRIVGFSIPDLRSITIMELRDYEQIQDNFIINRNTVEQFDYMTIQ